MNKELKLCFSELIKKLLLNILKTITYNLEVNIIKLFIQDGLDTPICLSCDNNNNISLQFYGNENNNFNNNNNLKSNSYNKKY